MYGRKARRNCHVAHRHNYYSVSCLAAGRTIDSRVTGSKAEAILGGERLATHPCSRPMRAIAARRTGRTRPRVAPTPTGTPGGYTAGQVRSGRRVRGAP